MELAAATPLSVQGAISALRGSLKPAVLAALDQPATIWEFPKIRGTLFWCPYNRDPTIYGTRLGCSILENSLMGDRSSCSVGTQG